MIIGRVVGRHALIPLLLHSPNGQVEVEFVLDTGFAGFITLPVSEVTLLGLTYSHPLIAHLADGSRTLIDVYRTSLIWDGQEREVEVLATGGERLLGTFLLEGYDVRIQFADQGLVTLELL